MSEEEKKPSNKEYKPSQKEQDSTKLVYDEFDTMNEVMTDSYREFNDRTLTQFLDDSQKRANSFVPSRAEQGKDDWQSNVFTPTTRNKIKTLIASYAKTLPPISMTAVNDKRQISVARAEVMKNLVEASYTQGDSNPEKTNFYDGWNCAINGTVIKYDGYLKVEGTVKLLTNYDLTTGDVKFEEKKEIIEDEPIEINVPIQNFYIKNPYISDLQAQPAIIWVDYFDAERFDYEFQGYKNKDYVKSGAQTLSEGETQLFFGDRWKLRTNAKDRVYEVLRYYNKTKDRYIVIVNGVVMLDCPMLWGKRKKRYPFASAIFEPFANSNMFWGNSLPNILMAEQDVENALVNSMVDKTYRSLATPMLVGMANKDAFDLEDEYVDSDTKIYVDDVGQVTPMPVPQVNQSEIGMLNLIRGGLDRDSTDQVQGGTASSGATAREVVIANERAEELKGLFGLFMKDLWLQKYRLRSVNVLMNYSQAKVTAITGEEEGKTFSSQFKVYDVPNAELSDGTKGNLSIEVVEDQSQMTPATELDVREEMLRIEGRPTEIIQITSDYLDDYEYIVKIEAESVYQKSKALKMAMNQEMVQGAMTIFPEIFMANKDKFFKKWMEGYGESPDQYLEGLNMQQMMQPQMGMPGQEGPPGALAGQITAPTKSLPNLSGVQ